MSAVLQQILDQHLPLPGLAAWAVRLPDFAVGQETFDDWFTADQVAQSFARLIQALEVLGRHQIVPLRLCWVFEGARVHLAARPDGACLALFAQNRQETPNPEIGRLLDSFLAVPEL